VTGCDGGSSDRRERLEVLAAADEREQDPHSPRDFSRSAREGEHRRREHRAAASTSGGHLIALWTAPRQMRAIMTSPRR
jgi:hypothetical protein